MRTVVFGGEGIVGQWLLSRLSADPVIDHVVVAPSAATAPRRRASVAGGPGGRHERRALVALLEGADAVVWLPGARAGAGRTGTEELRPVLEAVAESRVLHVVAASSVAAYSPGAESPVDEDWPTEGVAGLAVSEAAVAVERCLDEFALAHEVRRVVRLRLAMVPDLRTGQAAAGRSRVLRWVAARPRLAVVPWPRQLSLQVLHPEDAAGAVHAALRSGVRGPYNVAAEPVLTGSAVAQSLGGRPMPVPTELVRPLLDVTRAFRVQPVRAKELDLALRLPMVDVARAHQILRWTPRHSALEVVQELRGALLATPGTALDTGAARARGSGTRLSPTANG